MSRRAAAAKPAPAGTRWAVVTGASAGIGAAIAESLAERGYGLVLIARRQAALQALAERLAATHRVPTRVIAADLTQRDAVDALAAQIEAEGLAPELLVNNAGVGLFGLHEQTALADEQAMIDLNITALTRLTKQLLPGMLARGHGRVLNLASVAAFLPGPYMAVYYATKAYVLSYSEALAEELDGRGVTVTALCPGPTETEFESRAKASASPVFQHRLPDAASVARLGVEALLRGDRVAVHGAATRWVVALSRLAPRRWVAAAVAGASRPR